MMIAALALSLATMPAGFTVPDWFAPAEPAEYRKSGRGTRRARTRARSPQLGAVSRVAVADTYYRRCADARAAGAAPIRAGSPGYGRHLDRDGDGIACE